VVPVKYPVILIAGGKGTRSIDPSVPKSLHLIESFPLIKHQILFLEEIGCRELLIVGNFGFLQLSEYVKTLAVLQIQIKLIAEEEFGGTLGALQFAKSSISESHAWVILGDLYFQVHLENLEENLKLQDMDLLVLTHPNDHPFDSDLVTFNQLDEKITEFHSKTNQIRNTPVGNSAVSGIYFVNIAKLDSLPNHGDISGDLIPFGIENDWKVLNFTTIEYCKDSGTPRRIKSIEDDLRNGVVARRSEIGKRVCFIDLDDTLIANVEVKSIGVDFDLSPDLAHQIRELNDLGIPIIVVSNQPGISKGFFTFHDWCVFRREFEEVLGRYGAFIDDWVICPHHPEFGHLDEVEKYKVICKCRKPKPGMFLEMQAKHGINLERSIMIGDSIVDAQAAGSVGIKFIQSTCFFVTSDVLSTNKALEEVVSHLVNY
jgi:mannose-1-phosphate guanylyltransferase/phosphomannomutase